MATRGKGTRKTGAGAKTTRASGATKASASTRAPKKKPVAALARGRATGRSGGVVDAPGKRHRTPMPADPGRDVANSQAAKMRAAMTMVKTNRRRGRG